MVHCIGNQPTLKLFWLPDLLYGKINSFTVSAILTWIFGCLADTPEHCSLCRKQGYNFSSPIPYCLSHFHSSLDHLDRASSCWWTLCCHHSDSGDTEPAFDYFISRMESMHVGLTPIVPIIQQRPKCNFSWDFMERFANCGREGHVHGSLRLWHWLRSIFRVSLQTSSSLIAVLPPCCWTHRK